jgi:pyruvate dehydrogenase E2 component (dihydrolipoamide acetyltransferase)
MREIVMPKLSDSMEEGTILSWLKASGESVELGDELLEIETDKSTVTYAAETAGALEILVEEGASVTVGAPIARIGVRAEPAAPVATSGANGNGRSFGATPLAKRTAAVHGVALADIQGTGPLGRITRADVLERAGLAPRDAPVLPTARAVPQ